MKKKIITVLLTIFVSFPCFLIMPKAASTLTSQYTSTTYGDYWVETGYSTTEYDYEVGPFGIKFPVNSGSWLEFHYNFKQEYNGYVTFTLKSNLNTALNTCVFSVQGATFTQSPNLTNSTNTRSIQLRFNNSTGFVFRIMKQESFTLVSNSTFGTNSSITITSSNFNTEPDLSDVMTVLNNIDFYLPGMSTSLQNIASNTSTISSDIAIIKGYLDGLEGYTDQIEPLLNQLVNISKIQSFPIWQQNSLFWANRYGSLNFDSNLPYFTYLSSNNSSSYTNLNRLALPPLGTYSLIFYSSVNINMSDISLYYPSDYQVNISRTYAYTPPSNLYLYRFDFTNPDNALRYFELEISKNSNIYPLFWGNKSMIPDDVHLLFGDDYDNTYTRLLQTISNGINGTYDTSQYDQYEQTIDGLNDSMRDRFNNSESSFQNNINSILTPDQTAGGSNTIFERFHFNVINSVFTGFLSDLFTAAPAIQYVLLFGLLLLVLGVFI